MSLQIFEDTFGSVQDPFTRQTETVRRFTFKNNQNVTVQVITLGAIVTAMKVPNKSGLVDDIALGYDDASGYLSKSNPYFGATIGRVCNRIGYGKFPLDGVETSVAKNLFGKHQLHGGFVGFDKAVWSAKKNEDSVTMTHINPDGHEGYPGEVTATVTYKLTNNNEFIVNFNAKTTKTTVINLTNHGYFNLAGHNAGPEEIYQHYVQINADKYTITDKDSIPTGGFQNVEGTSYDLRKFVNLGERIPQTPNNGFDDNFCANLKENKTTPIAKVWHQKSGRTLEISTDQPGVQFYTSNGMPDPSKGEEPIHGKDSASYKKHGAFCLETQKYPDAPNHPNFPSIELRPGQTYSHEVIYKFGISENKPE